MDKIKLTDTGEPTILLPYFVVFYGQSWGLLQHWIGRASEIVALAVLLVVVLAASADACINRRCETMNPKLRTTRVGIGCGALLLLIFFAFTLGAAAQSSPTSAVPSP